MSIPPRGEKRFCAGVRDLNHPLGRTEWHAPGWLTEPALARISATVYVGAVANWAIMAPLAATSGFGLHFYAQVVAFALPFALGTIPAYRWLTAHSARAKAATLGTLAGLALLTPVVALAPFWLKLAALAAEGLMMAVAADIALIRLRGGSGPDHTGRIIGSAGAFGVATIMASRALGGETPNAQGLVVQVMPLLLAIAAVLWLPTPSPQPAAVSTKKPDIRWTAAACLMGCAVALTASAAYNSGGGTWSDAFCVAGFILSGVLLDTERLTIAIGAAATAAVLAALSTQPSAGAISGLAQGLVQPLPWYIVMTRLRRDLWALILACGEATVWAFWNAWDTSRQADAALMAAMLSLLSLSVVGTFAPKRNIPAPQPEAVSEVDEPVPEEAVQPEVSPTTTVADALKKMYGTVLTPRELQVGQLVVLGVASRDIAAQLYLSESTVKTHLKSLYRKTETANRNDLYRRLVASSGDEIPEQVASNRLTAALMAAPKDPVTELIGRQAFERVATERMMVDQANHRPTAILYLALQMEHKVADKQSATLAVVAGILRTSLRGMDLLFRYSESEFVAVLSGSDGPGANLAGQRLAHRIRAWAASRTSPVEVKVGCASTADGNHNLGALLAQAIERTVPHAG